MLRTGLLLPRSSLFPALGLDLLNGIKNCLQSLSLSDEIKLITDNIGFGINEQEIYTKAERMLFEEDASIVIVFADSRIADMLQPLFTASNKILLIVNFGANYPVSWQPAPTTITHSLNFTFHARLTGQLAAKEGYSSTANTISYYDGGYSQCYAMLHAYEQAGGTAAFNYVTHLKTKEFTLDPLTNFLEDNSDVGALLCLFAGDMAMLFYQAIADTCKQRTINLFVSPMMLDEVLKGMPGSPLNVQNVKGFCPWITALDNTANRTFTELIQGTHNKPANIFSLLGWETGLILQAAIDAFAENPGNASQVVTTLCGITFNSPRGWLKIDAATHHSYGPSRLVAAAGNMELNVIEEVQDVETEWKNYINDALPSAESSSWRNTYLCI